MKGSSRGIKLTEGKDYIWVNLVSLRDKTCQKDCQVSDEALKEMIEANTQALSSKVAPNKDIASFESVLKGLSIHPKSQS